MIVNFAYYFKEASWQIVPKKTKAEKNWIKKANEQKTENIIKYSTVID